MSTSTAVDLSKRAIVFVTGASKGIGRTIAIEISRLVHHTSVIVLLARSKTDLEQTKTSIREIDQGLTVFTYCTDLSKIDAKDYEKLAEEVIKHIDTAGVEIGLIFHNAGSTGTLREALDLKDPNDWVDYYNLNLFSVTTLNSVLIPKLRPIAPQLIIVNITSLCGRAPFKNLAMYGSGKAARELYFKVLALEQPNLIVLNYSPGPVDTDMFDGITLNAADAEVRDNFTKVKQTSILTPIQTVGRMLKVLEEGTFKSGDTVDFFDRV